MLIQAQGDGNSQAGQRLQRLTTELVRLSPPTTWAQCSASWLDNPAGQHFHPCPEQRPMHLLRPSPISIDDMLMRSSPHTDPMCPVPADHGDGGDPHARAEGQGAAVLPAADVGPLRAAPGAAGPPVLAPRDHRDVPEPAAAPELPAPAGRAHAQDAGHHPAALPDQPHAAGAPCRAP